MWVNSKDHGDLVQAISPNLGVYPRDVVFISQDGTDFTISFRDMTSICTVFNKMMADYEATKEDRLPCKTAKKV